MRLHEQSARAGKRERAIERKIERYEEKKVNSVTWYCFCWEMRPPKTFNDYRTAIPLTIFIYRILMTPALCILELGVLNENMCVSLFILYLFVFCLIRITFVFICRYLMMSMIWSWLATNAVAVPFHGTNGGLKKSYWWWFGYCVQLNGKTGINLDYIR